MWVRNISKDVCFKGLILTPHDWGPWNSLGGGFPWVWVIRSQWSPWVSTFTFHELLVGHGAKSKIPPLMSWNPEVNNPNNWEWDLKYVRTYVHSISSPKRKKQLSISSRNWQQRNCCIPTNEYHPVLTAKGIVLCPTISVIPEERTLRKMSITEKQYDSTYVMHSHRQRQMRRK